MTAQTLRAEPVIVLGGAPVREQDDADIVDRVPRLTWVLCAALLLCGCILVSMTTTTDPDWWHLYFSRLGMMGDFSSFAFNGGLVASGAIIAGSSWMLRIRLTGVMPFALRSRIAMRVMPPAIAGLGISLLAIGAYPLSVDPIAHERATNGAVLSFAVLLLSHRVLLWQLEGALRRATMISAVTMIVALAALKAEVISLTVFEAIAFAIILWWVHLLEQSAHRHGSPSPVGASLRWPRRERAVTDARRAATRPDTVDALTRPDTVDALPRPGTVAAATRQDDAARLARATTRPRLDVSNPARISRSSSAPTSAPNASAPGSSMMPDASGPAITGSKPRSSISRDTASRSAAASPAIAMALRPGAPAGRASSSMSWYPMCPSPFTTRAPARCR